MDALPIAETEGSAADLNGYRSDNEVLAAPKPDSRTRLGTSHRAWGALHSRLCWSVLHRDGQLDLYCLVNVACFTKLCAQGVMHACGHDGHTSMLLATAAVLVAGQWPLLRRL